MDSSIDGVQLLKAIANKSNDLETAERAFGLFIGYFESKIKLNIDIHASKLGFDENVAFEAIQCAFNKVWMYPTFDMNKAHIKDPNMAIIVWLIQIAISQMYQFASTGVCAKIKEDEDLSIIEDPEAFVNSFNILSLDADKKMEYVMALNDTLSMLDEKHRIIFLTYKAYYVRGKKLPRVVLEKLRSRLGIVQATVRVYKREACETVKDYTIMEL